MPFIFLVKKKLDIIYTIGAAGFIYVGCALVLREWYKLGWGCTAGLLGAEHLLGDSEVGRQNLR